MESFNKPNLMDVPTARQRTIWFHLFCWLGLMASFTLTKATHAGETSGTLSWKADFLIVPEVRIGAITRECSTDDLVRIYGKNIEVDGECHEGGIPNAAGTILFPDNPRKRVEVLWWDEIHHRYPKTIQILARFKMNREKTQFVGMHGSDWKTKDGITIGTTLREIEKIKHSAFALKWDMSDTGGWWGVSHNSSSQNAQCHTKTEFALRFDYRLPTDHLNGITAKELKSLTDYKKTYSSSDPIMQKLNPSVVSIAIHFSRPIAKANNTTVSLIRSSSSSHGQHL